ncbi:MAG: CHAT domain-containing protein [Thermoanaerobaculia bacterium]
MSSPPRRDFEPLAASFAAALQMGDPRSFDRIAAGGRAEGPEWQGVTETLEKRHSIRVRSHRVLEEEPHGSERRLLLEIDGVAVNGAGREVALPPWWSLEVVEDHGEWVASSAWTRERRLAFDLSAAPRPRLEEAFEYEDHLDRGVFLREIANAAASDNPPSVPDTVSWVLEKSRSIGDLVSESEALRMFSFMETSHDPAESSRFARQANEVAERSGDPDAAASTRFSVGIASWFQNDADAAIAELRGAASMIDQLDDSRIGLRALFMASLIAFRAGRLGDSVALAAKQRENLRRHPSLRGSVDLAFLLSEVQMELGNPQIALTELAEAEAGARALRDPDLVLMALSAVARARMDMGQLREALSLIERLRVDPAANFQGERPATSFGPRETELVETATMEANILIRLGELKRAESVLKDIQLTWDDRRVEATFAETMSALRLAQDRAAEAVSFAQEACRAAASEDGAGRMGLFAAPWEAHAALARALHAEHRDAEAEATLRAAIGSVEASRGQVGADEMGRARYLEARLAPYSELVGLLVAEGRARDGLSVAESSKARALRDVLERGKVDLSAEMTREEKEKEEKLEERVRTLNRQLLAGGRAVNPALSHELDSVRVALETLREELFLKYPTLRARRVPEVDVLASLPERIPADAAAIEYVVRDQCTYAFTARHGPSGMEFRVVEIPLARSEITRRVEALANAVASRDPGFAHSARDLYDLLLSPVEPDIRGVRQLAIVPDGALWRVPFSVLRNRSGRAMIEQVAIYRTPSLSSLPLRSGAPRRREKPRLLAFGNPTISGRTADRIAAVERGPELGPLPDAEDEVRAIGRLYGSGRSEVRVGTEAREHVFKEEAGRFDVIHLATHGLLDDGAPMYSSVVLGAAAGEQDEDGLLEAREIADLSLHADLVVLSACQTGRGMFHAGEGIIGLSWALLAAGTPTAVVADWKTDSVATSRLMVDLHRRLLAGDGKAEALRGAELSLRRDPRYAHPYYWAAFEVVGDGR